MNAPDLSIETMQQAKEALRLGEFVSLPSPYSPAVKRIENPQQRLGERPNRGRSIK